MVKVAADEILEALRNGPMREPAHAWLYEVCNGTGYHAARWADALVVSCYPSRGIWMAGVEVKVDRGDWRRELDDPNKAQEIQKYCDFWWIAAPAGVVLPEEVPQKWGHYELSGKKLRAVKQAPKLKPDAMTPTFVASVLRNLSKEQARLIEKSERHGYEKAKLEICGEGDEHGPQTVEELLMRVKHAEAYAQTQKVAVDALSKSISDFEKASGVTGIAHGWQGPELGVYFRAAMALYHSRCVETADRLERIAKSLREAHELIKVSE